MSAKHGESGVRKAASPPVLLILASCFFLPGRPVPAQESKSQGEDALSAIEASYWNAAEKAGPSVAAIKVEREAEPAPRPPVGPFGQVFSGGVFAQRPGNAWCTGTIVEPEGVILTTHFNVSGRVKSIVVRLADGREFEGTILGYDGTFDVAAIKIDARDLPVLRMARLEALQVGQPLLALGRGPDGRGLTINPGILSAPSRLTGGRAIQTDAKLNFGNVGGPLVDLEGRLVAITCKVDTKHAADFGQNSGVGFAVAHDRLSGILPSLKDGRAVAESRRPYLGIEANVEAEVPGVEISDVRAGSAAENAGMKSGDVIVEFDGRAIRSFDELRAAIGRKIPGDRVKIKVRRETAELELQCELGSAPE